MCCNKRRAIIINNYILILIMITKQLSCVTASSQAPLSNGGGSQNILDYRTNDNLYDIFKKRLERVQNELSYHKLDEKIRTPGFIPNQYEMENRTVHNNNINDIEVSKQKFENLIKKDKISKEMSTVGGIQFTDGSHNAKKNNIKNANENLNRESNSRKPSKMLTNLANSMRNSFYDEYYRQLNGININAEKRQHRHIKDLDLYNRNWLNGNDYAGKDFTFRNRQAQQHHTKYLHSNLYRRQSENFTNPSVTVNSSSLYPSVLTKALEISLNRSVNSKFGNSLLANVARQMNTSTLDLAEKLTKSSDLNSNQNGSRFDKIVQSYITNIGFDNKNRMSQPASLQITEASEPQSMECGDSTLGMKTSTLKEVLDRVLDKLEKLHDANNSEDEDHPDGTPCDILGSWCSTALGVCFDIQINKDRVRDVSPAEMNNRILSVEVVECIPPKHHTTVDLEWKFGGSAVKEIGGPFYMYSQKRSENLVGTFLGYCRTCGGIDTIFGSWTFLSPSKDCLDISLAFDVKRDILRRDRMEMKRKERFKDLLYKSRIGKSKKLRNS